MPYVWHSHLCLEPHRQQHDLRHTLEGRQLHCLPRKAIPRVEQGTHHHCIQVRILESLLRISNEYIELVVIRIYSLHVPSIYTLVCWAPTANT
jgi:hypothetical protein